ncbi:unnamed protein product [Caenorhabditis nigoni]|uniref:PAZ domain-containing protein n=1 Tax=Caenorhabditis nigoni TaxID=1611254 RepID=A0A2G5T9V8_9PELO|nr:hypothetical protein B9Z55_028201 [Caenorhabditis nigoni]PIC24175.1 hypothetical protein B9Z55_017603 [Caenorhabditis nigoni]
MLSRMDPKSADVVIDELDFSTMPGTQTCIQNSRWNVVNLKNAFQPEGPWEFALTNNSRSYLNLKRTWLIFTYDITDELGNPIVVPPETTSSMTFAPINNIAHSIVKNFTLHVNSQLAYHNSSNYAYKAYFENLLMYGKDIKDSTLTASGFYHDNHIGNRNSPGFKRRAKLLKNQVAANISIDLMNQPRVMMNNSDVKLTVYPNKSDFLIEAFNHGTQTFKFNVRDVYCLVHEFDLTDGLSNELEAAFLEHKMIQYPMISPQVRSFYIEPNRFDAPANTLFTTKMPRRLFLGLVSNDSFNGTFNTSPFDFKPFDVTDVHIDFCGRTIPGRPMDLDFPNNKFIEAYVQLQETLGHTRNNFSCNSIDVDMYKSRGFTIFGFELSSIALDPNLFEMVNPTNVSVRINFKKVTPPGGLYCVVYAEFDQILVLTPDRAVVLESII